MTFTDASQSIIAEETKYSFVNKKKFNWRFILLSNKETNAYLIV